MLIAVFAIVLSLFSPALEEGATYYDDGTCVEADGTEGLAGVDGQCVTPADYDAMFSYENLAATPSQRSVDEGKSVAEVYGIEPADDPASDRPVGVGVSDDNRTFRQRVRAAHTPHMPIAD